MSEQEIESENDEKIEIEELPEESQSVKGLEKQDDETTVEPDSYFVVDEENILEKVNMGEKIEPEYDRLKILCLHGYRQNAKIFQSKLGSFRKKTKKRADYFFINAPHRVLNLDKTNNESEEEVYSWLFNALDNTFDSKRKGGLAIGFEDSVNLIENAWKENGPFDGVLGFSQGASFAAMLCDLQQRGLTTLNFQFAIICAGFISDSLPHMKFFEEPIHLPSFHIYGEADELISKDRSILLKSMFRDKHLPLELEHPGGHYFPGNATLNKIYLKFLVAMQKMVLTKKKIEGMEFKSLNAVEIINL